jgi:hypothetical protein
MKAADLSILADKLQSQPQTTPVRLPIAGGRAGDGEAIFFVWGATSAKARVWGS